jgi:DNA replication protein DnaC
MKITKNCKECGEQFEVEKSDCLGFDFSQVVSICSRKCLEAVHKRELEEKLDKDKQKKLRASYEALKSILAMYPKKYQGAQLSDFDDINKDWLTINDKKKSVRKIVERWLTGSYWCFFLRSNNPDTGKTRLGLVLLAELAKVGIYTTQAQTKRGYIKAPLLASYLESERFDNEKLITFGMIDAEVLFIDDIGTEKETQSDLIAYLIDEREQENKKTIVTTNLDDQCISLRYGSRFLSRISRGLIEKHGISRR